MSVCYWPVTEPHLYSADKFPAYIFCAPLGCRKTHVYGFPINEYPGLIKVNFQQFLCVPIIPGAMMFCFYQFGFICDQTL